MSNELACFISRIGKTESINDIVQSPFQERKKGFSSNPLLSIRFFKNIAELVLQNPVHPFDFLLFPKLSSVVRELFPSLTMLSGRVVPPIVRTLLRIAPLPFEKELQVFPPAKPAHRFRMSCQRQPPNLISINPDYTD